MAKSKYIYTCNQCGYESTKWNGKCPSCGATLTGIKGETEKCPYCGTFHTF